MKPNAREIAMLVALLIVAVIYVDDKLESKAPIVIYTSEESESSDTIDSKSANNTLLNNSTTLDSGVENATTPQPDSSDEPQEIRVIEEPKYPEGSFSVEMGVSSSPVALTPWTGNGVPFINLYYQFPDGTAFNDTGMLHNGLVSARGYVGYDLCVQGMRFWKWEYTEPTGVANEPLVYWSQPAPDDPYKLLGSGQSCYTRATASSGWLVQACYEGDGEITPPRQETMDNGDIVNYLDFMDECWKMDYQFPT